MILLLFWILFLSASIESLSLRAVLEPLNATHLKVSIQNSYSQPIHILGWNNYFQSSQNGAHGSFKVFYEDKNGTKQTIQPASNRPTFQFMRLVPSHFTVISSKGWHAAIFDITELFQIPRQGEYNVSMYFATRAYLGNTESDLKKRIATAGRSTENFSELIVTSKPKLAWLSASLSQKTLYRRSSLGLCSDDRKLMPIVLRARENARSLAKYAQNVDDSALWTEYFNNSAVELRVKRVYQGIINYGRNGNYYGITEYCDPLNEDPECTDDEQVLAYRNPYQEGNNTATITLCAHFMYLQQQITCNYPSDANPSMVDQGGLFLHELTHVRSLVGYADISDGAHADCYSWNCVQEAVAGDNGEIPPWHIGRAYEFYAYAARALGTRSCNINAALVDNIQPNMTASDNGTSHSENSQRLISSPPTSTLATQQATSASSVLMLESALPESDLTVTESELMKSKEGKEKVSTEDGGSQDEGGECLVC